MRLPWRRADRLPPDVRRAAALFVPALAIHVAEEAPGFTGWARRYASDRYTQRDFVVINAAGLVMTGAGTAVALRSPSRAVFLAYYAAMATQQAVFNAVFHAGTTAAFCTYSPGTVSAVGLVLPVWVRLTRAALRERLLTRRSLTAALAIGAVLHTGAVARQVFFVGRAPAGDG